MIARDKTDFLRYLMILCVPWMIGASLRHRMSMAHASQEVCLQTVVQHDLLTLERIAGAGAVEEQAVWWRGHAEFLVDGPFLALVDDLEDDDPDPIYWIELAETGN